MAHAELAAQPLHAPFLPSPRDVQPETPDALVSIKTILPAAELSESHVWALVRERKFPQPAVRLPKFTRWRRADVAAWLADPAGWIAANQTEKA